MEWCVTLQLNYFVQKNQIDKMMIDEKEDLYVAINSNLCTKQCISRNISSNIYNMKQWGYINYGIIQLSSFIMFISYYIYIYILEGQFVWFVPIALHLITKNTLLFVAIRIVFIINCIELKTINLQHGSIK